MAGAPTAGRPARRRRSDEARSRGASWPPRWWRPSAVPCWPSPARAGRESLRGSTSAQGKYGGSASRNVSQTSSGYNVNKTGRRRKAAPRRKSTRTSTRRKAPPAAVRPPRTRGASRPRGTARRRTRAGTRRIEGSASTSTGRVRVGRGRRRAQCVRPAGYAGTVNTKYNGTYATAGATQSVRRLDDRDGRALRREGHHDAALRLSHQHVLRPLVLHLRRRLLPALLPTAACTTTTRCRRRTTRTTRARLSGR